MVDQEKAMKYPPSSGRLTDTAQHVTRSRQKLVEEAMVDDSGRCKAAKSRQKQWDGLPLPAVAEEVKHSGKTIQKEKWVMRVL